MSHLANRKVLWQRLAQLSRNEDAKLGLVSDRGAPKTAQDELELLSRFINNDLDLQQLLLIVDHEKRRQAYEQLLPRLNFRPRAFDDVIAL